MNILSFKNYLLIIIFSFSLSSINAQEIWTATSTTNAPDGRMYHPEISAGNKIIIWGGYNYTGNALYTGGIYDTATNIWTTISSLNAPTGRYNHTAIWTGSKMIIWGGTGSGGSTYLNDGFNFDTSNIWTPISTVNAPSGRYVHTAIWTGSKMIIWGGAGAGIFNTGGIYNFATNSWDSTSTVNAPTSRCNHTAIWTGSKMIIWGGWNSVYLNTGGIYDPSTNTWTAISTINAPSVRRYHTAVWTGSKMVIWGGYDGTSLLNTGGVYDPLTNTWTSTSTVNAHPATEGFTTIWTGTKMIVWGGNTWVGFLNSGKVYDVTSDTWTAISTTNAPVSRYRHSAVWTGSKMMIWGGWNGSAFVNSGGSYFNSTLLPPPPAPTLSSPSNGAINISITPTIIWNSSLGAASYRIQISADNTFATRNFDSANILGTTISLPYGKLTNNTLYYWRVNASNSGGASNYSEIWNFTTTYFIDSVSPGKNKINVPLTSNMNVWFHQSMNSAKIDSNSVTFFGSMTGRKRGTLTYNSGNNSMQIAPNNPFKYNEIISTTLDSGIKTSAGNSIIPFVWSFTSMAKTSNMVFNEINSVTVGASPYSVAAGDFNGDGYIDLAIANANGGVSILINNGNGTFTKQSTDLPATGRRVIAGDFNNDGYLDLAACDGSVYVKIFINDGNGNFTLGSTINSGYSQDLTTADFNGDGYLDIATSGWTDNRIVILMNNGNGTFTQTSAIPTGSGVYEVVSGDFNGDGFIDIAAPNYYGGNVVVYKNNGTGSFSQLSSISVGGNPLCMTAGDFDGDGNLDLAVSNQGSPKFDILKNNGSGTFTVSQTISPGNYAFGISSADLDGDGDPDLVVCLNATSTPLKIYKNDGLGTFTLSTTAGSSSFYGIRTAVADLNNDGVLDIAAADASGNLARIIISLVPPRLMSPANNSIGNLNAFSFSWNKMPGASNYRIQIATDSLFSNLVVNDSTLLGTDSIKAVSGLSPLTWFYWRMASKSTLGISLWSDTWKFKTQGTPTQVFLNSPANNSVNQPISITFKWLKSIDQTFAIKNLQLPINNGKTKSVDSPLSVSNYWFEYSIDSTFATVIGRDSTLSDTTKTISGLNNITKYYWRVKAKNQTGWGGFSNSWIFTTIVPIPSAPLLLSPLNYSTGNPLSLNLVWNKPQYADVYNVVLATDTGFTNILLNDSTMTDSVKAITNLSPLTIYYWKVRAKSLSGWSNFSSAFFFKTIGTTAQVILSVPANYSTNQPVNVTFKWYKAVDQTYSVKSSELRVKSVRKEKGKENISDSPLAVSNYWFEIGTDSTFTSILLRDSVLADTTKIINGLGNYTKYFWRVKAMNQIGWGSFSNVWSFTTIVAIPNAPVLSSPTNNSTGVSLTPSLIWNAVPGSASYRIQVSADSLFTTTLYDTSGVTAVTITVPANKLTGLTKFYWRVNATNAGGTGLYSSVWNFTTLQNLSLNLKVYLEGFWDGTSQVTDTVTVYLVNSTNYTYTDSANVVLSTTGTANITFTKAPNGSYYVVVNHRNHLETWSALGQSFVTNIAVNYDFTTASNKAYGDNMKQAGSVWVLFGGDANRDGSIDATDIGIFIGQFGNLGYYSGDFNGDESVDASDVIIILQNFGLIKITPGVAPLSPETLKNRKMKSEKAIR